MNAHLHGKTQFFGKAEPRQRPPSGYALITEPPYMAGSRSPSGIGVRALPLPVDTASINCHVKASFVPELEAGGEDFSLTCVIISVTLRCLYFIL